MLSNMLSYLNKCNQQRLVTQAKKEQKEQKEHCYRDLATMIQLTQPNKNITRINETLTNAYLKDQ